MNKRDEIISQQIDQGFQVARLMADTHAQLGNYEKAETGFREAMTLLPERPESFVGLGVLCLNRGRPDDAMDAFRDAIARDHGSADAMSGIAMVYQHKGEYALAFDWYLKSLEADSDNLVTLLGLFQSACQMGSFEKVIHYLEVYRDMHPADVSVLFCLATLYQRDGRIEQTRALLEQIMVIDPDHEDASAMLRDLPEVCSVAPDQGPDLRICR